MGASANNSIGSGFDSSGFDSTMTKSYGLKAVGKAAAATIMLPVAVGVDLIILPGPQVRNGVGSLGFRATLLMLPLAVGFDLSR